MKTVDIIALILLIVGGLNWFLVGMFDIDLVASIFGDMTTASRIAYALVGVSALWCLKFFGLITGTDRNTTNSRDHIPHREDDTPIR